MPSQSIKKYLLADKNIAYIDEEARRLTVIWDSIPYTGTWSPTELESMPTFSDVFVTLKVERVLGRILDTTECKELDVGKTEKRMIAHAIELRQTGKISAADLRAIRGGHLLVSDPQSAWGYTESSTWSRLCGSPGYLCVFRETTLAKTLSKEIAKLQKMVLADKRRK